MNKNKLLKTINELRNNIKKDLDSHTNICLYVKTWVIGGLDMLENKAKGKLSYVWPYKATYSYLLNDFLKSFYCCYINEKIKSETIKYLCTCENIKMINQLISLINK